MKKINYPIVYYKLKEGAYLGILVGSDYQVIDKDIRAIKTTLQDYIQKQYKKYDDYPYMDIIEPKLKVIDVKIRPTYKEKTGSYPLTNLVKIPVPVIYGETEQSHYECYLPLFEASFYYYDPKQFRSLVTHFASSLLNDLSPEQLNRHLLYSEPKLDFLSLRVNESRNFDWGNYTYTRKYEMLTRLATRYPYTKAMRKKVSTFPEAAWELEDKVAELIDKLINVRANLLIVGNHGVGKTAVLKQAIRKVAGASKGAKLNYTFWQIMPQRITASSKYLGEWQESVENLIEELNAANGILWVENIIQLLQVGGEGAEDSVAAFMISFLQQGNLQLLGEVTEQELESMRRLLPGFVENFQIVKIEELSEQKIQLILQQFASYSEKNLKVKLPQDAVSLSYRLLKRYYPYQSFPGKAVKFLGQCVSEAQINGEDKVTIRKVIDTFVKNTGLPELFLRDDLLLDQADLKRHFESNIIGQTAAVEKLSAIVKVFKAGLNNPYKPIATLIFAGPTGVGKTASAKALANYFFGKGQKKSPLIRIDMSEFQHSGQITRFIGAGKEVGKLVQDIRERPFAVLLLDEIEKADASIFDALLTVLDEGMLVDAFGRVTSFRNAIIIMTSNLGASNRKALGFKNTTSEDANYQSAIAKHFRPEFVNRIDGIVMFNSLGKKDIEKITDKELEEVKKREGFTKLNIDISFTEKLVDHLSEIGFDERYGARPLQRAIEQTIVNPMANWLLEHPKTKDCKLLVDFDNGLKIKKLKRK